MKSFDGVMLVNLLIAGCFVAINALVGNKQKPAIGRIVAGISIFAGIITLTIILAFSFRWESDLLGIHNGPTTQVNSKEPAATTSLVDEMISPEPSPAPILSGERRYC